MGVVARTDDNRGVLGVSDPGRGRVKRSYRPAVEAMEALRLLANASPLPIDLPAALGPHAEALGVDPAGSGGDAWDAALLRTSLADLIGTTTADPGTASSRSSTTAADADAIVAGLSQLDRYLNRSWYRAGIPTQQHDDCTQAVYTTLLTSLGRGRFDALAAEVGHSGIRETLSRETPEGPDFFRAIDTVKKRAQRERVHQPIDAVDVAADPPGGGAGADRRGALIEAIDRSLSPREAALIRATLRGETPAEIAQQWGVAAKTVSNEKSRVIQKLRDTLSADLLN